MTGRESVLIAGADRDRSETIRELSRALGLTVHGVRTGAEALAAAERLSPALVLLAADLGDPCAYEVLRRLRERFGDGLPIAFLGAADAAPRDEVAALLLGADDYLGQPAGDDGFNARVRRLLRRRVPLPLAPIRGSASARLTKREREILQLLVNGVPSPEIAASLCITRKTAATHVEHILVKLGAHTQAQAVAFALRDNVLAADGA